jgi:hypothetical protein
VARLDDEWRGGRRIDGAEKVDVLCIDSAALSPQWLQSGHYLLVAALTARGEGHLRLPEGWRCNTSGKDKLGQGERRMEGFDQGIENILKWGLLQWMPIQNATFC